MTDPPPSSLERPWRLFIALPMPSDVAGRLEAALAPYREAFPGARWQRPDAFHVTLRFLGSTPPERVDALTLGMARCGATASSFRLATDGSDGIVRRSGGVAWLRIGTGGAQVGHLARCLFEDAIADDPRVPDRGSAPAPHVTIARRADRALIDALGRRSLGDVSAGWLADRVVLYRSHTGTPAGSSYEPLAEVRL
jgi:RNA 2',3'-cyclic 3'-phosphodiesterase